MRDSYYDIEHHVSAHLWELQPGDYLLTELQTARRFRGQGHAGRLLARVLEEADRESATLTLSIDPDGSPDSLEPPALKDFYGRRGFVEFMAGAMRREPPRLPSPLVA